MTKRIRGATVLALAFLLCNCAHASVLRGKVVFAGRELAGVQVTARSGDRSENVISDSSGGFQFADLADGKWRIEATMQCFESLHADVDVTPQTAPLQLDMKLLPAEKLVALAEKEVLHLETAQAANAASSIPSRNAATTQDANAQANAPPHSKDAANQVRPQPASQPNEENELGADGFLLQGSVNNAATSSFASNPTFGNTRAGQHRLYTGGIEFTEDNSALDAQPYSLSGVSVPRPAFNNTTGTAHVQGPLNLPRLMPHGPNAYFNYHWSRTERAQMTDGIVPTAEERSGNLAGLTNSQGQPVTIYNPATGVVYAGNQVPVITGAAALLALYPLPNLVSALQYNYQAQFLNQSRGDGVTLNMYRQMKRVGTFNGRFGIDSSDSRNTNLFGFLDHGSLLSTQSGIGWSNWFQHLGMYARTNYNVSRRRNTQIPYFANLTNISGNAGINGNDQTPANWGPPGLNFTSGVIGLSDGITSNNRSQTDEVSTELGKWGNKHSIKFGGNVKRLEFNNNGQQNPRGAFTFTGAASGSDLADFLLGIPDASILAYGNADKYLRQTEYSSYFFDDWRLLPNLSINLGLRWEFSAPVTELFGRLVNLDVESGFSAVAPVIGSDPVGSLTGMHYPPSLIRADDSMIEPRIGLSWRLFGSSSLILRAGYGKYANTSVYTSIVQQMTQQAPLSKSLSVQNSASCPLTLADGFVPCATTTAYTFGVDPNFRVGFAQMWKLQAQYDLPRAMQISATYLGIKGTQGAQEILPNSYPLGADNPCPGCPVGFVYESSGGNSIRHAGELILRRRMRSGFGAMADYTFAKSIDDDAYLGGQGQSSGATTIAQNWRDPDGERSLSSFDQRHLLKMQVQYTSGMGLGGDTLLGGWRGRVLKEWTVLSTLNTGSGLPETPIYSATIPDTGFTNILRPSLTGAPIYTHDASAHLNVAAYTAPIAGQWGNAGRYSITGPGQFGFDCSVARTLRVYKGTSLDLRAASTNLLNKVTYTNWNSYIANSQFGLPVSAGNMRSVQIQINLRFEK
jgi:hypothetical protein